MYIHTCLCRHQNIIAIFTTVKDIYIIKINIHNIDFIMVILDIIPEFIYIMTPSPVHQHQVLPIHILYHKLVLCCKMVINGDGTANRFS